MMPNNKENFNGNRKSNRSSIVSKQEQFPRAHKKQFAHIKSPIGIYINETPTTPLLRNIQSQSSNTSIYNTQALQEHNSELLPEKSEKLQNNTHMALTYDSIGLKTLPKRAYKSSSCVIFADKTFPTKIPGGENIQKYLDSARKPAVFKHEGKFKILAVSNNQNDKDSSLSKLPLIKKNTLSNDINNTTIEDTYCVEDASDDVSFYTIFDA